MGVMIIRFYSTFTFLKILNVPLTPDDPYIFMTLNGTEE
jgi:hypothetical protein